MDDEEITERRCGYDFKHIPPDREYCDDKCKALAEMWWSLARYVMEDDDCSE